MERTTIDLWFGAFVTAGFIALLVLALKVGNLGAERAADTYRVEARFDNIGGLKVRGPVRSAGVLVGRVAEIRFDNAHFQATVVLALDKRYSWPKDTSAAILTSGLLGEILPPFVAATAATDESAPQLPPMSARPIVDQSSEAHIGLPDRRADVRTPIPGRRRGDLAVVAAIPDPAPAVNEEVVTARRRRLAA